MPKISVIIPVYNAEKYLERCIKSILGQSFSDFELILVNDGSSDRSLEICNGYSSKDSRVLTFSQYNGGASSARNYGIDKAKGEYVCFIDADDYVEDGYLEDLYNDMNHYDVDMVMHGMVQLRNDCQRVLSLERDITYCLDNKETFFKDVNLFRFCGPCCKLMKMNILNKYGIRFNQNIICAEDFDFFANYLSQSKTVRVSTVQNYYYEMHVNSVSSRVYSFEKEYTGLKELYMTLKKLCNQFDDDSLKLQVNEFLAYYVTRVLVSNYQRPLIERSIRISNLKEIDWKYIKIYRDYDRSSTFFLRLSKFLLVHQNYKLYDLAYSSAIRK